MDISMNTSYLYRYARTRQYGGATLLFVLIMLLVVSIIGVSSVRSTIIQEKMASNTKIRNVTFEAAESALAAGEIRVANTLKIWEIPKNAGKEGECWDGVCDRNTTTSPNWIVDLLWNDPDQHTALEPVKVKNSPIEVEPKYIIEDLGQSMAACDPNHIDITQSSDCPYTSAQRYFRVVGYAKAYGTQVMLQSTYLDPNPTRLEVEAASKWNSEPPKCNGDTYSPPGERCCPPDTEHSKEWKHGGSTCPSYCEIKPGIGGATGTYEKYDSDTQQCCNPNPINNERSVISKQETCPTYCGNNPIDESKEVCCIVQGTVSVLPGTDKNKDCPQFCGNDPRGKDQVCCSKGSELYSYTANSTADCPKFCDIGGGTLAPVNAGQKCCPNASRTGYEVINGECPDYCDGKVLQAGQTCCSIPSLAGGSSQRIVNGSLANCPKFCGPNEILPGQLCCGNPSMATAKIYDSNTGQCCLGSNNATKIIGKDDVCCKDSDGNPIAISTGDCPIYCGNGANAIRYYPPDEQCCRTGANPIKASSTEICCSNVAVPRTASGQCPETCNGQSYDPGLQSCCGDWNDSGVWRAKAPGEKNNCPMYCKAPGSAGHNKQLPPSEQCCTDGRADNYGEIEQCVGGSGSTAGS